MTTERGLPEIGSKFVLPSRFGDLEFEYFQPKSSNIIKIHLPGEGIWACLSDADMDAYRDDDVIDPPEKIRIAVLRNTSIHGFPWGSCIPIRMRGPDRPEAAFDIFDGMEEPPDVVLNQHDND